MSHYDEINCSCGSCVGGLRAAIGGREGANNIRTWFYSWQSTSTEATTVSEPQSPTTEAPATPNQNTAATPV